MWDEQRDTPPTVIFDDLVCIPQAFGSLMGISLYWETGPARYEFTTFLVEDPGGYINPRYTYHPSEYDYLQGGFPETVGYATVWDCGGNERAMLNHALSYGAYQNRFASMPVVDTAHGHEPPDQCQSDTLLSDSDLMNFVDREVAVIDYGGDWTALATNGFVLCAGISPSEFGYDGVITTPQGPTRVSRLIGEEHQPLGKHGVLVFQDDMFIITTR